MLEYKGKLYARVSDILKPFINFDGIAPEILQAKANIGTETHQAIEDIIKGQTPSKEIKIRGYVESFNRWVEAVTPTFLVSEERYYCDERSITGRIDTVIKLQGEEEGVLVDFKTSVQESPTWIMQAHLYYYLMTRKELSFPLSKRFLFIKLDKWGQLPIVFQYKFSEAVNRQCLQAVDSYWERINVAVNL